MKRPQVNSIGAWRCANGIFKSGPLAALAGKLRYVVVWAGCLVAEGPTWGVVSRSAYGVVVGFRPSRPALWGLSRIGAYGDCARRRTCDPFSVIRGVGGRFFKTRESGLLGSLIC